MSMEYFNVIRPSPDLAPLVRHYWFLKVGSKPVVEERTVPAGDVSLVFHRGSLAISSADRGRQPRCFASGISVAFNDLRFDGAVDMIVVVFQPYAAGLFFEVSPHEFRGQNICASLLDDRELTALRDQVCSIREDVRCAAMIERYLRSKLRWKDGSFRRIKAAVDTVGGDPTITVSRLADSACLGEKQFKRLFAQTVGTCPKEFMRIVRFQRALSIMQTGASMSMTQVAMEAGYYDQSHMVREFREFSGYTPTGYLSVCNPFSDYFTTY